MLNICNWKLIKNDVKVEYLRYDIVKKLLWEDGWRMEGWVD